MCAAHLPLSLLCCPLLLASIHPLSDPSSRDQPTLVSSPSHPWSVPALYPPGLLNSKVSLFTWNCRLSPPIFNTPAPSDSNTPSTLFTLLRPGFITLMFCCYFYASSLNRSHASWSMFSSSCFHSGQSGLLCSWSRHYFYLHPILNIPHQKCVNQ